jgi:cell division protein FtsB
VAQKVNQEDLREKNFIAKFQVAAAELNAASYHDIESLKFKDSTSSRDYRDLIIELGPMEVVEIQGDYQGKAWKITDADDNSIIIVEHETGLEILYVVGAVASIVGLVPVIVNTWNNMRDHWLPHRGRFGTGGLERRRFGRNDKLIEEPAPPVEAIILQQVLNQYDKLSKRISSLEAEVSGLKSRIDSPTRSVVKKRAFQQGRART